MGDVRLGRRFLEINVRIPSAISKGLEVATNRITDDQRGEIERALLGRMRHFDEVVRGKLLFRGAFDRRAPEAGQQIKEALVDIHAVQVREVCLGMGTGPCLCAKRDVEVVVAYIGKV